MSARAAFASCSSAQRQSLSTFREFVTTACLRILPASSLPLIGEIQQSRVHSDEAFWLSVDQSRVPVEYQHRTFPDHYRSLPVLYAAFRVETGMPLEGTWASRKLRKIGLTPALLDSLPLGQAPHKLVMASQQIQTALQQHGASLPNMLCLLHIIDLEELGMFNMQEHDARALATERGMTPRPLHTFQVLPRRLSVNRVTGAMFGVTLMNTPSTRIVRSEVPVVVINQEDSPSVKRGGFALITKKMIPVRSLATNIPRLIVIDCATFETGHRVFVRDLRLVEGQVITGIDEDTCVLKMDVGST